LQATIKKTWSLFVDPKTEKWIALYTGKVMVRIGTTEFYRLKPFAFYVTGKAELAVPGWAVRLSPFPVYNVTCDRQIKWLLPR
jgi:hypothetical protein